MKVNQGGYSYIFTKSFKAITGLSFNIYISNYGTQ
jgi:hypothetical protein